jgi:hypothetical protein
MVWGRLRMAPRQHETYSVGAHVRTLIERAGRRQCGTRRGSLSERNQCRSHTTAGGLGGRFRLLLAHERRGRKSVWSEATCDSIHPRLFRPFTAVRCSREPQFRVVAPGMPQTPSAPCSVDWRSFSGDSTAELGRIFPAARWPFTEPPGTGAAGGVVLWLRRSSENSL